MVASGLDGLHVEALLRLAQPGADVGTVRGLGVVVVGVCDARDEGDDNEDHECHDGTADELVLLGEEVRAHGHGDRRDGETQEACCDGSHEGPPLKNDSESRHLSMCIIIA